MGSSVCVVRWYLALCLNFIETDSFIYCMKQFETKKKLDELKNIR